MALQYPSFAGLGVDAGGIMDAFDMGFDRARAQKYEKEAAGILARLNAPAQTQQPSLGATITGPWGSDQQVNGNPMSLSALGQYAPQQQSQAQVSAPAQGGNPLDGYFAAIRSAESSGNDNARNPNSSALGRFQFTDGTWNELMRNNPQLGLTADGRTDPAQQEKAIRVFTGQNAKVLSRAGIQVNPANLYAAHFLGAGGATQALSQADNVPMAQVVGQEVVQANPFLANMTVGDFKQWTGKKTGYSHQGGAVQAVNAMATGAPMQVADASGQVVPQQAQGQFPPAPSSSPLDDEAFMRQAFANPLTRDYAIAAAKSRIEARQNANDPMKRLEFQKAELELQKLRQEIGRGPERKTTTIDGRLIDSQTGQVIAQYDERQKPTSDMQEYEYALKQGFQGSFVDFQLAQKKAGATNVTVGGNSSKFVEKSDEAAAKRMDEIVASGQSAGQTMSDMQQLMDLGAQIGTGKGAQVLAAIGPYAQALGIDVKNMNEIEAYEAITSRLAPQMRAVGSGSSSDRDVSMFMQSLPNLRNTQGGNEIIGRTMQAVAQNKMDAAEIAGAAQRGEITWQEADKQIRELPNPYEVFKSSMGKGRSPNSAPRQVNEQEYQSLPSGSQFIAPDGSVRRKP